MTGGAWRVAASLSALAAAAACTFDLADVQAPATPVEETDAGGEASSGDIPPTPPAPPPPGPPPPPPPGIGVPCTCSPGSGTGSCVSPACGNSQLGLRCAYFSTTNGTGTCVGQPCCIGPDAGCQVDPAAMEAGIPQCVTGRCRDGDSRAGRTECTNICRDKMRECGRSSFDSLCEACDEATVEQTLCLATIACAALGSSDELGEVCPTGGDPGQAFCR